MRWNAFRFLTILLFCCSVAVTAGYSTALVYAQDSSEDLYKQAKDLDSSRRFYASAVTYFNVFGTTKDENLQEVTLGQTATSLAKAGLYNASSYFFIKAIQTGNKSVIGSILLHLPQMIHALGSDLFQPYLLKHTVEADYPNQETKSYFNYFVAKSQLQKGEHLKALQTLTNVTVGPEVLARAAYLRGTAYAMADKTDLAIDAFKDCKLKAKNIPGYRSKGSQETEDLESRCLAGLARTYYQALKFNEAEEIYDLIPKASWVYTDILFEQAWNYYSMNDYNRALGKLVSYRSPTLKFVFLPEVEVLRAQTFLSLCLFEDANKTISEFNDRYTTVGTQMKDFLEKNDENLAGFYELGKSVYKEKIHTANDFNKIINRFVRGPNFSNLVKQEGQIYREALVIRSLAIKEQKQRSFNRGFGGFLDKVLSWRKKSIKLVGGLFVRNSMSEEYQNFLTDLDKMSFIKLEIINQSKKRLQNKNPIVEDTDGIFRKGTNTLDRKDHQYLWKFNGEFWLDEIGDYAFALESECG